MAASLALALSQIAVPIARAATPEAAAHLVPPGAVDTRLADAAALRTRQVQVVQAVLDTAEARRQAGVLGVDAARLRAAVPHLSDAELRDLSQRAAQVKDVAAGHRGGNDDGLVVLGVVLLLAGLVVLAATSDYGDMYDDCGCY